MFDFDYTVHKDNSVKIFKETCKKIQQLLPTASKKDLLIDVD